MRAQALQQLALSVRQRADLGGQQNAFGGNSAENITDSEMVTMLNASYGWVWDVLSQKFPENYSWGNGGQSNAFTGYSFPIVQGTYIYNTPFDLYKVKGIDLALDSSGQNWASVRPFTLKERNLFSFPLFTTLAYAGWQNMRWQLQGNLIQMLPQVGPLPGLMRMLYTPCCPTLVAKIPTLVTINTAYVTGDLIYKSISTNGEPAVSQVFVTLNGGNTGAILPVLVVPGYGQQNGIVIANSVQWAYQGPLWNFTTTLDGISGYEDLVVLETAIKCGVKQESDVSAMMAEKQEWMARINQAAENRMAGDPMTISGGFGLNEGGPAYGNGFGPWGNGL